MGAWKKRGVNLEKDDHNYGCLRKHNYGAGAGWKSTKKAKIGGVPSDHAFGIKHKKRGRGY